MTQTPHRSIDMQVAIERATPSAGSREHRQANARGTLRMKTGTSGHVPGIAWRHTGFHAMGATAIEVSGPDTHDMFAIQLPLRGQWNVEFADGRSSHARPLLSRLAVPTALFSFSAGHYAQFSLQVTLDSVAKWYGNALPGGVRALVADRLPGSLHKDLAVPAQQRDALQKALLDTNPLQNLVIEGISLQLLGQFLLQLEDGVILEAGLSVKEARAAQDARQMVEENVADPPSMGALAAATGVSARRLEHALREEFGMTLHGIVVESRFAEACRALRDGEEIKSIAYRLGYANVSAFGYAFRKRFSMSPGAWREQSLRR